MHPNVFGVREYAEELMEECTFKQINVVSNMYLFIYLTPIYLFSLKLCICVQGDGMYRFWAGPQSLSASSSNTSPTFTVSGQQYKASYKCKWRETVINTEEECTTIAYYSISAISLVEGNTAFMTLWTLHGDICLQTLLEQSLDVSNMWFERENV